MTRVAALALASILTVTPVASAAEREARPVSLADAAAAAAKETTLTVPSWAADRPAARPMLLPALYGGYAALQALDIYSTKKALAAGSRETNPAMRSGNTMTMVAVKAAAGAGTIYFAERAWKKNKPGAIALMVALNGATALIASRNLHNANRSIR
jgi:hypothetical protein